MRTATMTMTAGLLTLVLQTTPGGAQPAAERLDEARTFLGRVEAALRQVESERVITAELAQTLDGGLGSYAEGLKGAYDTMVGDAKRAGETEGAEGNVDFMPRFEDELDLDVLRLERVAGRVKAVQSGVRTGAIQLDPTILESMSPEELSDFSSYLTREALQKYREQYPHLPFPEWSFYAHHFPEGMGAVAKQAYAGVCALPGKIDRALMPPVEAAIAWPCVAPCKLQQWYACIPCVINAGYAGLEAWNSFVACWNGSGKPWWVWTWLWKTYCVLNFAARLA